MLISRVAMVMVAAVLVCGAASARGESCSPAMCAGLSPVCWEAYQKIVVAKNERIKDVHNCRALAADLDGAGKFIKVPDLTPKQALCACEAAFWSMGDDAQGLPNIDDTTQERSNSASDTDDDE